MARNFGSTGASSLLRAATAALNQTNTYNDAAAAAEYDNSIKDQAAYQKYSDYLNGRINTAKTSDPTKALSLSRTLTSANRSFNSAEIGRMSDQVRTGAIDNRSKYAAMVDLFNRAGQNGDYNLQQNLGSQLDSLRVTIQNEDKAKADAATAAGNKAAAATKKQYTDAIAQQEDGIKQLNALKLAGKVTPAEYDNQMRQFYQGSGKTPGIFSLTQALAKNEQANGDPYGTYGQKLDQYSADPSVQKYVTPAAVDKVGLDNSQTLVRDQNGLYKFANRSANEVTGSKTLTGADGKPVLGQDGLPVTVPTYANPQAFTNKTGDINGFQYVSAIKNGQEAPGAGPGVLRRVDNYDLHNDDPSGVPYFWAKDAKGNAIKKYVGYETKTAADGKTYQQAIMGNKPTDISGNKDVQYGAGKTGKIDTSDGSSGNLFKNPFDSNSGSIIGSYGPAVGAAAGKLLQSGRGIPGIGAAFGAGGDLLSSLFHNNDVAQQAAAQKALEDRVAQQNAAKDAATLAAQRQHLLSVRAAPPPPPAPPKITAKPSQYNLPALPAPVPLGNTGVSVPSSTGNYQKDVLNLGRSLGGLL